MKEICEHNKCSFWVNNNLYYTKEYTQYNKTLHEYVVDNYIERENIYGITIYKNY